MKNVKFLNIGYGNVVSSERIICVVSPESAPIKRLVQDAREKNLVVDATYGRRTRAVIIMDSGSVILTPLHVETLAARLNNDTAADEDQTHNG